jgi:hypothetical protein
LVQEKCQEGRACGNRQNNNNSNNNNNNNNNNENLEAIPGKLSIGSSK